MAFGGLACGPRKPQIKPGVTYFWRVTDSKVELAQCTDDPKFVASAAPIAFNESTFFIYKVDPTGQKATLQDCAASDVTTCTDAVTDATSGSPGLPIVYDVAGDQLFLSSESKSPIGTGGCRVQNVEQRIATDEGETLSLEIKQILGLVDNPTNCDQVEAQLKTQSANPLGLQGCIVTFTVGASFH